MNYNGEPSGLANSLQLSQFRMELVVNFSGAARQHAGKVTPL
jgi:hypothetical protein